MAADLAALLVEKRTGGLISARFVLFAGVGLSGMAVNLAVLSAAQAMGARSYALSAGGGDPGGDGVELRPQQHPDLPRATPARAGVSGGA